MWINLENIMRVKEAIHKGSYTAHFHLYGIIRTRKSVETESSRLPGMGERRDWVCYYLVSKVVKMAKFTLQILKHQTHKIYVYAHNIYGPEKLM